MPLLLYGANGFTGELVARQAVVAGLRPILAGRDAVGVGALAARLGLEHRVVGLDDPAALRAALAGCRAVLHCAGPYASTSRPMVDACLAERIHYLDLTGEIAVLEAIFARADEARRVGSVLLPAVGFDVVPTDCLAATLHEQLPEADELELAFVADGGGWSRGTVVTMLEGLHLGGAARQGGRLVPEPVAAHTLELDLPVGRRRVASIPWGDLATAWRTTGIPNLRVYAGISPPRLRWLRRMRWATRLTAIGPLRRAAQRWVRRRITGPDAATRANARCYVWGRVRAPGGDEQSALLVTPEGYTLTADAAVAAARRVLRGEVPPGSWTPAQALGAAFVTTLPGVRREAR